VINDIRDQLNQYTTWLKDKTALRQVNDWVEITSPLVDRHNDHLQVYVKQENGSYILTDDGYTLGDLINTGCKLDTKTRQDLLRMTLAGFGVQREGDELIIRASTENFPQKKHNLLQAMLAVNDLFFTATPIVTSLFVEDVAVWLDQKDIRYMPRVKLTGRSGFDYVFDFAIPKSKSRPERLIKAINRPSTDAAKSFILSWLDTREARPDDSTAVAFLNDTEHEVSSSVLSAFSSYDVEVTQWSNREQYVEALAA